MIRLLWLILLLLPFFFATLVHYDVLHENKSHIQYKKNPTKYGRVF